MQIYNRDLNRAIGAVSVLSDLKHDWPIAIKVADLSKFLLDIARQYDREITRLNQEYAVKEDGQYKVLVINDELGNKKESTQIDPQRYFEYLGELENLNNAVTDVPEKLAITKIELMAAKVRVTNEKTGNTTKEAWDIDPNVILGLGEIFVREDD